MVMLIRIESNIWRVIQLSIDAFISSCATMMVSCVSVEKLSFSTLIITPFKLHYKLIKIIPYNSFIQDKQTGLKFIHIFAAFFFLFRIKKNLTQSFSKSKEVLILDSFQTIYSGDVAKQSSKENSWLT